MTSRAVSRALRSLVILVFLTVVGSPQAQLQVGYALVAADGSSAVPVGTALFSYTNFDGVLVSQAGVGASEPISSGRIFVDEAGTQTGIALVNPGAQAASVSLVLRDASGRETERSTLTLRPGEHIP